jgi:hypothetical protein
MVVSNGSDHGPDVCADIEESLRRVAQPRKYQLNAQILAKSGSRFGIGLHRPP